MGGIAASMYGGDFADGFAMGAITGAAGFLFNETPHALERLYKDPNAAGRSWNQSEMKEAKEALKVAGETYLKTMNKAAELSDTVQKQIPEEIRPTGAPYPGFWGEVWKSLLPIRKFFRLP